MWSLSIESVARHGSPIESGFSILTSSYELQNFFSFLISIETKLLSRLQDVASRPRQGNLSVESYGGFDSTKVAPGVRLRGWSLGKLWSLWGTLGPTLDSDPKMMMTTMISKSN